MKITVIGLGKLGLPSAACLASAGHDVVGYDTNTNLIEELRRGLCPIREPSLDSLLDSVKSKLSFTSVLEDAVRHGDFFFIIVPTPSTKAEPRFSNEHLCNALEAMLPFLKKKRSYFVIDIVSTVMPGTCNGVILPMLWKEMGVGSFGLVYNPEFIALGDVIAGFTNPDLVLVGEEDRVAGTEAQLVYKAMGLEHKVHRMSLVSAEIAKLSLNYYVTMKISFANWVAFELAPRFNGADAADILSAIGRDRRIGEKYLRAGTAFGGPCFPRDVRAMRTICGHPDQMMTNFMSRASITEKCNGITVIFGMAYKVGTHVTEESPGMDIARDVAGLGPMRWVDPLTKQEDLQFTHVNDVDVFKKECRYESPYDACEGASTVVIMTPDEYWKKLDWDRIRRIMKQDPEPTIIDPWGLLRQTR